MSMWAHLTEESLVLFHILFERFLDLQYLAIVAHADRTFLSCVGKNERLACKVLEDGSSPSLVYLVIFAETSEVEGVHAQEMD